MAKSSYVKEQIGLLDMPFMGGIGFDSGLEDSIGNADKLLRTDFAHNLKQIVLKTPEFNLSRVQGVTSTSVILFPEGRGRGKG